VFPKKRVVQLMGIVAIALAAFPAAAQAQRGRSRGRVVVSRPVVVAPYYYYSPFYDPFFWNGWGYPGQYPIGYYGAGFATQSEARIQVTPRETEVYVDGYRAGIVDDFDGFLQRLRVQPGGHVIELYLDGYRPVSQTILFAPDETYRIRHAMEPLGPGEAVPPRPTPDAVASPLPQPPGGYDAFGRPAPDAPRPYAPPSSGAGVIAIRVQPADAVVLVDGEEWQGSASGDRLEIQVAPGAHRIEVRKNGYVPFGAAVDVKPGETSAINISLSRAGGE